MFSLAVNALLLGAVLRISDRKPQLPMTLQANASASQPEQSEPLAFLPQLGPRHQLSYAQWVELLQQEADAIAAARPDRLAVLAGDSISLWFPSDLLPPGQTWLNQGISGETSGGLLERLAVFDHTEPEVIFVMIGINDLVQGQDPAVVVANLRQIVDYLVWAHPQAKIVMQSILPHADQDASWEGRAKLLALPNSRIQAVNRELAAIAAEYGIYYLDLYPLFVNEQGYLNPAFTTDGLHLNEQGYLVWRSALQLYSALKLEPDAAAGSSIW